MTIREVVATLQKEKQANVPSRFPCRAIMVRNIRQYCELLSELKKISDISFVQTQEVFTNADVMPKYENLQDVYYRERWVVLTGVSEYLRLFAKSEQRDRRFASLWSNQVPATSTGRIIIPLWGCEAQWFDHALNLAGDSRKKDFYFDCTGSCEDDQNMKLLVLSGRFEKYISKLESMRGDLKIGLQEWFEYWLNPSPEKEDFVLLTKRSNSVTTTNGNVSIHLIADTLNLIQENMPGANALTKDNSSGEMQEMLLEYALKGNNLDDALLSILNVSVFSGIDIMGKWKTLSPSHQRFVKLWFSIHPDHTYLCHCFSVAESITGVPDAVMLEIFKVWADKPDWVHEYHLLSNAMGYAPDNRFFDALDKIPVYEKRLEFMTGSSRDEKIYLLRMVGKWLKSDRHQVLSSEKLKQIYPELFAYLCDDSLPADKELREYMIRYKSYKLENTLPEDEDTYFSGVSTDTYDMRYTVLSEHINSDTIVLWIDALGIEWFPLLCWTLSQNCDATIAKEAIAQASLPTETEFNDQWKRMSNPYDKLDKLDKLAHKGVIDEPDYYACIQEQLTFVMGIHKKVTELMKHYHRVIVTGDHGTSRLAARFFHNRDAMPLPPKAESCSHGRYCKLEQGLGYVLPETQIVKTPDGCQFVVFKNYDHFPQPGFAAGADDENAIYGEVHGGATPEESLIPIIVLDSNYDIPLSGKWEKSVVKISMKKARLHIDFNKPINGLQAMMAGIEGDVACSTDPRSWNVTFKGIAPGTYAVQVYANNKIVTMPDITIKPALGGGDGDLPI